MNDNDQQHNELQISSDMLWNKWGMIQQAIIFVFLLIIYTVIVLLLHRSPKPYPGLESWFINFKGLFVSDKWYWDIIFGIIVGTFLSHLLLAFDNLVAWLMKRDIPTWIHRADHLLPQNRKQKKWAVLISIVGSIQEEILFRGYILLAILPLWSHWLWSVLILSTFFALFHAGVQGFWSTLWIFLSSIVLCVSVAAGKSLYFAIMIHIMINLNNLILIPLIYYKKN